MLRSKSLSNGLTNVWVAQRGPNLFGAHTEYSSSNRIGTDKHLLALGPRQRDCCSIIMKENPQAYRKFPASVPSLHQILCSIVLIPPETVSSLPRNLLDLVAKPQLYAGDPYLDLVTSLPTQSPYNADPAVKSLRLGIWQSPF